MSEKRVEQIKVLDARKTISRIILVSAIILVTVFGWFAIRWQLGNMLAELTLPTAPNSQNVARLAVNFAPSDPMSNWLVASTNRDIFTSEKISASLSEYERVVQLAPNDFRWWIELARAREQAEDITGAEKAYLRAVEIAPNYIYPHWQFGNFYLRQGRSDEAFAELKKAAENNSTYRHQVFSLAWEYYEQDTAKIEQLAEDSPAVRAALAMFYAGRSRAKDSLRIWNTLPDESKQENFAIGKVIERALFEKRNYGEAIEFTRQLGTEPDAKPEFIQNGSFEQPIGESKDSFFGWVVSSLEKVDTKIDPTQKREGNRSVRVSFNGYSDPTFFTLLQYVVIKPSAKYHLSFWLRTENMKSGGTPTLEIYNANDDKIIAVSKPFPNGKTDWQQVKIEFMAPENAEAIGIRTTRAYCGLECPIFGTFWYDDFKLEKIK